MTPETAKKIVAAIVKDFTGRRGLRHQWEEIDEDIQQEIINEWEALVLKNS